MLHDGVAQSIERHDGIENAEFGAGTRHSVDGARGLILPDCVTATVVDCCHATRTVIAHPGHDYPERSRPKHAGCGEHSEIDSGPVQGVTRFFRKLDERFVPGTNGQHMPTSGRDERHSWLNGIVVAGLANVDLADAVQALGEGAGESRGHMLDDEDSARE
jgi:hypothetical protein